MYRPSLVLTTSLLLFSCGGGSSNTAFDSVDESVASASASAELTLTPAAAVDVTDEVENSLQTIEEQTTAIETSNTDLAAGTSDPVAPIEETNNFASMSANEVEWITEIHERNYVDITESRTNFGGFLYASSNFYRSISEYHPDFVTNTHIEPSNKPEEYCEVSRSTYSTIDRAFSTESIRVPDWKDTAVESVPIDTSLIKVNSESFNVGDNVRILAAGERYLDIPMYSQAGGSNSAVSYFRRAPTGIDTIDPAFPLPALPLSLELETPLHIDANLFEFPLVEEITLQSPYSAVAWSTGTPIVWNASIEPNSTMQISTHGAKNVIETGEIRINCVLIDDGYFVLPQSIVEFISDWPTSNYWTFQRSATREVEAGDATNTVRISRIFSQRLIND